MFRFRIFHNNCIGHTCSICASTTFRIVHLWTDRGRESWLIFPLCMCTFNTWVYCTLTRVSLVMKRRERKVIIKISKSQLKNHQNLRKKRCFQILWHLIRTTACSAAKELDYQVQSLYICDMGSSGKLVLIVCIPM